MDSITSINHVYLQKNKRKKNVNENKNDPTLLYTFHILCSEYSLLLLAQLIKCIIQLVFFV